MLAVPVSIDFESKCNFNHVIFFTGSIPFEILVAFGGTSYIDMRFLVG